MNAILNKVSNLNKAIQHCHDELAYLLENLHLFEKKYNMSSQVFFKKFEHGELTHETDFFEWYAYLDLSKRLIEKMQLIEKDLGEILERKLLTPA